MPLIGSIVTWPSPSAISTSKLSVILQPKTTKQKRFLYFPYKKTHGRSILGAFVLNLILTKQESKKHFSPRNVIASFIQNTPS